MWTYCQITGWTDELKTCTEVIIPNNQKVCDCLLQQTENRMSNISKFGLSCPMILKQTWSLSSSTAKPIWCNSSTPLGTRLVIIQNVYTAALKIILLLLYIQTYFARPCCTDSEFKSLNFFTTSRNFLLLKFDDKSSRTSLSSITFSCCFMAPGRHMHIYIHTILFVSACTHRNSSKY